MSARSLGNSSLGRVEITGEQIDLPLLLHASRVASHRAQRIGWHCHDGFELIFLLQGATTYEFAGREPLELRGGHFLVIPPGQAHRGLHAVRSPSTLCGLAIAVDRPDAGRNTTFTSADLARLRATLRQSHLEAHPFSPALRWLVAQLVSWIAGPPNQSRGGEETAARTLICAALLEAERQMQAPPAVPSAIAAAALAYLRLHLHETVRIADLTRCLGFSRTRIFDLFKTQTGLTPNDYLQRLRIEKAQSLLRQTNRSVTDIALETGFSSGQYFCTVFRRYTGQPPETYRRRNAPGQA